MTAYRNRSTCEALCHLGSGGVIEIAGSAVRSVIESHRDAAAGAGTVGAGEDGNARRSCRLWLTMMRVVKTDGERSWSLSMRRVRRLYIPQCAVVTHFTAGALNRPLHQSARLPRAICPTAFIVNTTNEVESTVMNRLYCGERFYIPARHLCVCKIIIFIIIRSGRLIRGVNEIQSSRRRRLNNHRLP